MIIPSSAMVELCLADHKCAKKTTAPALHFFRADDGYPPCNPRL